MKLNKTKLAIAMARNEYNFSKLAEKSDISRTTLSYINSGKCCRPIIAAKIATALNIDIIELIEE